MNFPEESTSTCPIQYVTPPVQDGPYSVVTSEERNASFEVSSGEELPFTVSTTYTPDTARPRGPNANLTLLRRKTRISGITASSEQGQAVRSEYKQMEGKAKRGRGLSVMDRIDWLLMRGALALSRQIDQWAPTRFNPVLMEDGGRTLWASRIQRHVLDRGKYTRRAIAAALVIVAIALAFVCANMLPWRAFFGMGTVSVYIDERGRSMTNVEVPHYLAVNDDASDRLRAKFLAWDDADPWTAITKDALKRGFTRVDLEYGRSANISFAMLERAMNATMIERGFGCLCAAHMGVPLNAVYIAKTATSASMLWEPSLTMASKTNRRSAPVSSNIYYAPQGADVERDHPNGPLRPDQTFSITFPEKVALRYLTERGFEGLELSGSRAACVVFCCELGLKKRLIDRKIGGVVVDVHNPDSKLLSILNML